MAGAVQLHLGRAPWGVKLRFFNPWLLLILLATSCTLAATTLNFVYTKNFAPSANVQKVLSGMGCFLLWCTALRYLQHHRTLYAFPLTINTLLPRVLPFALGFVPILIGYAILGLSAFGSALLIFSSPRSTLSTLWAITHGDSLHLVFYAVQSVNLYLGHLYLYSYLGLAIYVVINIIIIAIAEESYFVSQEKRRWLDRFFERAMALRPQEDGDFDVSQQQPQPPPQPRRPSSPSPSSAGPLAGIDQSIPPTGHADLPPRDRADTYLEVEKEEFDVLTALLNLVLEAESSAWRQRESEGR